MRREIKASMSVKPKKVPFLQSQQNLKQQHTNLIANCCLSHRQSKCSLWKGRWLPTGNWSMLRGRRQLGPDLQSRSVEQPSVLPRAWYKVGQNTWVSFEMTRKSQKYRGNAFHPRRVTKALEPDAINIVLWQGVGTFKISEEDTGRTRLKLINPLKLFL